MSQKYQKLKELLKTLFQLDQPDLDFGLYRIMHAKSGEISKFLDEDLLPQVKQAFSRYQPADKAELQKELDQAIEQARSLGVADPDSLPAVQKLRTRIANEAVDLSALESEVYDHLYSFFRRYYDEGDFLSRRVYKAGVYAIPYEGEETKFVWANQDQYYIKTSEYLRDYAFRLHPENELDPMRVHFCLVDATEDEHGNVKPAKGKDRVFILAPDGHGGQDFLQIIPGENGQAAELQIRFQYRPATLTDWPEEQRDGKKKPPAQKDLRSLAVTRILSVQSVEFLPWLSELSKPHIRQDGTAADRSRLEAHLDAYTKRNTFDYFIHKDLGAFLRRELDFYIKNEIMHLDDVENESVPRVEQYLSKIKVVRAIAGKIIDFLAQLEEFQKKLWNKAKFVAQTSYLITLSEIPDTFYPEILSNSKQVEDWVKWIGIDKFKPILGVPAFERPLTPDFIRAYPTLMVDTGLFPAHFTERLLDSIGDYRESVDGTLIHGENYQAIRLIRRNLSSRCETIYIDPPYNTDASAILYKNDYKDSSWMSLIENRVAIASELLKPSGILCLAIDDEEVCEARLLLQALLPKLIGIAVVRANPQSRKTKGRFSPVHEYALFYGKSSDAMPGCLELTEKRLARYPLEDELGRYSWMNFIRTGSNDKRGDRAKLYYPIFVSAQNNIRIPKLKWHEDWGRYGEYEVCEEPQADEVVVYPDVIGTEGKIEKNWQRGHERVPKELSEYRVRRESTGKISIDFKTRIDQDSAPSTWWERNEYASANYGAAELKDLFGVKPFDFPKAIELVADCLKASSSSKDGIILDFFAGSGTSVHATIQLNREDGGRRRFVAVEAGEHFDNVIVPRIKKVTFSPKWENGQAAGPATPEESARGPKVVRLVRLESYEDSLNNLDVRRTQLQQTLLSQADAQGENGFREQYILRYMLHVETRNSQSLLNIESFTDPQAYRLFLKQPGTDEIRDTNIDLVETFNWLTGMIVKHIAAPQRFAAEFERDSEGRLGIKGRIKTDGNGPWWFRKVEGTTPDGRNALIVWRKLTGNPEQDNLVLDTWMKDRLKISTRDFEFDLIYVNGDNNLENLKLADDTWKVRLIEEDFHRLMFDMEGV